MSKIMLFFCIKCGQKYVDTWISHPFVLVKHLNQRYWALICWYNSLHPSGAPIQTQQHHYFMVFIVWNIIACWNIRISLHWNRETNQENTKAFTERILRLWKVINYFMFHHSLPCYKITCLKCTFACICLACSILPEIMFLIHWLHSKEWEGCFFLGFLTVSWENPTFLE